MNPLAWERHQRRWAAWNAHREHDMRERGSNIDEDQSANRAHPEPTQDASPGLVQGLEALHLQSQFPPIGPSCNGHPPGSDNSSPYQQPTTLSDVNSASPTPDGNPRATDNNSLIPLRPRAPSTPSPIFPFMGTLRDQEERRIQAGMLHEQTLHPGRLHQLRQAQLQANPSHGPGVVPRDNSHPDRSPLNRYIETLRGAGYRGLDVETLHNAGYRGFDVEIGGDTLSFGAFPQRPHSPDHEFTNGHGYGGGAVANNHNHGPPPLVHGPPGQRAYIAEHRQDGTTQYLMYFPGGVPNSFPVPPASPGQGPPGLFPNCFLMPGPPGSEGMPPLGGWPVVHIPPPAPLPPTHLQPCIEDRPARVQPPNGSSPAPNGFQGTYPAGPAILPSGFPAPIGGPPAPIPSRMRRGLPPLGISPARVSPRGGMSPLTDPARNGSGAGAAAQEGREDIDMEIGVGPYDEAAVMDREAAIAAYWRYRLNPVPARNGGGAGAAGQEGRDGSENPVRPHDPHAFQYGRDAL